MFALRRAALRIAQQPTRQLSTIRPTCSRPSHLQPQIISSCRSFHQTLRWAAEEEKKPAEEAKASPAEEQDPTETVTSEPSPAEQANIKEESIATPEVADAADSKSASITETASEIVSEGKSRVESAINTAQDAVASAAQTVQRYAGNREHRGGEFQKPSAPPSKILYIGNLFFETTGTALEAKFARFGEIAACRIVTDPRGMSKGFGYVEFTSQNDADRAIQELNQTEFEGRRMVVQYHVRRESRIGGEGRKTNSDRAPVPPSKTLFIGNMSYQMSDRDLNDLFREIRNVLDVRVAIDRRSGQPRGFAHADFIDVESAKTAKEVLEKKVVYGRQLRVDYSAGNARRVSPPAAPDQE